MKSKTGTNRNENKKTPLFCIGYQKHTQIQMDNWSQILMCQQSNNGSVITTATAAAAAAIATVNK